MLEGSLVSILLAVIVFAAIYYFLDRTPMDAELRRVFKFVIGALAIIWLLGLLF